MLSIKNDRVAGIIAALIADNRIRFFAQKMNDLPLPSSPHWTPTTTKVDITCLRFPGRPDAVSRAASVPIV